MEMPAVIERYLHALKTGEGVAELPPPSCRAEEYLYYCIHGGNVEDLPTPISRLDKLLHNLAINGGGGSTEENWATDEEVQKVIDEIFNLSNDGVLMEDEVATDEAVNAVINSVFNL